MESVDLSKLQHTDACRFHDDGRSCTCGADDYARLQVANARIAELETLLTTPPPAPTAAEQAQPDPDLTIAYMCGFSDGKDAAKAKQPAGVTEDARDAARYRLLRRGQRWSVINGIGDDLRAEKLDAAIDAACAQEGEKP